MTKLYLIRHAEAEGNLYRIAHGHYNSTLTERGFQQVEALRRRFEDIHVDAVYASDLRRTCLTARAVYVPKGLTLTKRADLREVCVGCWEQLSWGQIGRDYPEQLYNFNKHLERWHVEGSEDIAAVRDRLLAAIRDIIAAHPNETVAVFSHGMALRILLGTLQRLSLEELGNTPHGDNTAVSLLEAEGDDIRVVFRDDNTHVKELSTFAGQTWWKRPNGVEPGLCFDPLDRAAQGDAFTRWAEESWSAVGAGGAFDADRLLTDAAGRTCLLATLEGETAGFVEFYPDKEAEAGKGWISLLGMVPSLRCHGYGIQLLGQAVTYYRPLGRDALRLALPESDDAANRFFRRWGFREVSVLADDRKVLEKDISLPEY